MTWRRIIPAAVVFAATGLTTIVVVSPYIASPVQEYIAVPWLLVLDLAAAVGIAGSCVAAALIGRPSNAVIGCGMTAAALLADAWIGHGLSPGFQALGFAAVPLLPSTLAFDGYFHATESTLQFPDTGDIADDLLTQLRGFVRLMTTTPAGGVISELVGLAQTDADLAVAMRDQYSHPRFQLAVDRLDEAKRVGQLRQDLDSESLVDQLWGACYHRLLLTGLPVTDTFVETLLGNLLAGIRPAPGRRRSSPPDSARRSANRAPVNAERLS